MIGALSEPYSWNDEEKLFEEVLSKRKTTRDYILEKIRNHRTNNKEEGFNPEKPMASILTSVYKSISLIMARLPYSFSQMATTVTNVYTSN